MPIARGNSEDAALTLPVPTPWGAAPSPEVPPVAVTASHGVLIRAVGLGLLLLGELLCLTIRFDTQSIIADAGDWGWLFGWAPRLLQMGIAIGATLCLSSHARLRAHLRSLTRAAPADNRWKLAAALHVVSFLALAALTSAVYERSLLHSNSASAWCAVWLGLVMATGVCWLRALGPFTCWFGFLRAESIAIALGTGVGLASLLLTQTARNLWEPLAAVTLRLVALLLHCCFDQLIIDEASQIIGTEHFQVQIAPQCSGCEGLGLMAVFLLLFFGLFRRRLRFPRAWLLWPIGLLAIWLCNAVRIALLIAIGSTWSPAVALGGFHSQAGWIFFNLVAISVAGLSLRSSFFSSECPERPCTSSVPDANVTGFLAPFLVLMAFNLLAAAFSDGFDWLYPAKVIATVLALVLFPQGWRMLRQPCEARGPIRFGGTWLPILNGVIVFAVWVGLVWDADGSRGMPEALRAAPPAMAVIWIIFRVFGSVITVPIVEELAFRGYLMRRLAVPDFASVPLRSVPFWCVAASSLAFGLMHQQWLAGILAGGAYAFAARSHNRLRDAVLAHAVTNGLIAFTVLSRDAWWLW